MNKNSTIRKIKDNKKSILILGVFSIILTVYLIYSLNYILLEKELYKKAKNGIYFEDVVLEPKDKITFKIYAKAGDWYHFHYVCKDFYGVWFEYKGKSYNRFFHFYYGSEIYYGRGWGGIMSYTGHLTEQFYNSLIYTVRVYNDDPDNKGPISLFFIVYINESSPPDCPFC
jgi:hypothetical protein